MEEKFSYLASVKGTALILVLEGALLWSMPQMGYTGRDIMILLLSIMGMIGILVLSKEVIYEYKEPVTTLIMFMVTIVQFIIFFAFQYWFLVHVSASSFSGFANTLVDFFFQSTLIFLFNPTITPLTDVARGLMLINLFGAMIIIMFVLQNILHFKDLDAPKQ